jgi:hypothetical protein
MSHKAPYISAIDSCSHNTVSVLHTYILFLSAANTVLVLLVYKCAALLTLEDTEKLSTPKVVPYILKSIRKMTSQISIFRAVLMKIKSSGT